MSAPIWVPSDAERAGAAITAFGERVGIGDDYWALWQWSVREPAAFWSAIWDAFEAGERSGVALADERMPGAEWFPGAALNYAERLLRDRDPSRVAVHHASELAPASTWTWGELTARVAAIRDALIDEGVGRGDRVAGYLPNVPDTLAACLATVSLGAIWTCCPPEFGAQAVIDRFAQVQPRVLLAVDGYRYGGRDFDRSAHVEEIHAAVGGALVRFGHLGGGGWGAWLEGRVPSPLTFARVAFDHPLWILYSSGTTGLPKPIVHGHGGILLEQLKHHHLHVDASEDDVVLWFTTTGWMMWNWLAGILLTGAAIVLYDGNPGGDVLWDLAAETGTTVFGTSAAFITAAMRAGVEPRAGRDLRIRAVGSTGSPLSADGFRWVQQALGERTWLFSTSGGTDVCTSFLGGVPTLPVHLGEIQAPLLGVAVESWDEAGAPVPTGEVGELVVTRPMPSMPVGFWGDESGERLRDAYFDTYPGVWRHGDWLEFTPSGGAVIHGRSDATINRGGVRMGTAEFYAVLDGLPQLADALVVDVPLQPEASTLWLFIALADQAATSGAGAAPPVDCDEALATTIRSAIRGACSPRHVPDRITVVPSIPRTLSGKLVEVPVKRILLGADPAQVVARDALAVPSALEAFVALAPEPSTAR